MKIFNDDKKGTKQLEAIEKVNYDLQGMTYTEFISQELNSKIKELRGRQKTIENTINEALEEIKETKPTDGKLEKYIARLREELDNIIGEINQVDRKYAVDFNLLMYAKELDRADNHNEGIDLLFSAIFKINEITSMLPKILKCYGCECYSPYAYSVIKNSMIGLTEALNVEVPKLQKIDKEKLLRIFNERLVIVEDKKRKDRESHSKYEKLIAQL